MAKPMQKQGFERISKWRAQAEYVCPYLSCRIPLWRAQLSRHIDSLHPHRCQARQQKCRRKPLPIHLTVNLVWQFIDAVGLQEARQLLVAKLPLPHLRDQQLFGAVFPGLVGGFRRQFQRASRYLWWCFCSVHRTLLFRGNEMGKLQIGHIRPNRHLSVGALPTRSHQQLL